MRLEKRQEKKSKGKQTCNRNVVQDDMKRVVLEKSAIDPRELPLHQLQHFLKARRTLSINIYFAHCQATRRYLGLFGLPFGFQDYWTDEAQSDVPVTRVPKTVFDTFPGRLYFRVRLFR